MDVFVNAGIVAFARQVDASSTGLSECGGGVLGEFCVHIVGGADAGDVRAGRLELLGDVGPGPFTARTPPAANRLVAKVARAVHRRSDRGWPGKTVASPALARRSS